MSAQGNLTVADLLREESLMLRLVAGSAGTGAEVRGIHISEIPDPTPWLSAGDVLLTTGLAIYEDVQMQLDLVRRLAHAGMSALGMAEGMYFHRTPPEVRAEADRLGFPVFEVPLDVPFKSITSLVFNSLHSASYYTLKRSLSVQDRLLALLLEDRGVDHLVSSVAMLLSTSVILFDSLGQVVSQAHARTRVTPHLRELVWNVYLAEGCRQAPGLCGVEIGPHRVFMEEISLGGRVEQILCFIYPRGEGVTEMARIIIEYVRKLLSLELHRSREEIVLRDRMKAALLEDVLSAEGSSEALRDRLVNFRFSRGGGLALLVLGLESLAENPARAASFEAEERREQLKGHVKESVDSFLSSQRVPFLSLVKSDGAVALVQCSSAEADPLRELAGALRQHLSENPPHVSANVGVSEPFTDLARGPSAFRQAREAAEVAAERATGGVVLFADLGPFVRALENQPTDWLDSLARQALGPLLEREDEKDHLLASLRVYVDSNRNVVRAAELLFVHPNTLRNRLRKVEELLGRSLEDTRTLVDLSLGLEALRIMGRKQGRLRRDGQ